ncbi:MAG: hypothetical protein WB421_12420 [Terriglobales bacterium]
MSAKSLSAEVSSCYAKVSEYQANEARKAKEEADQEAQDKKDEADEETRRKEAKDSRDAHDQKRAADLADREKADKLASEKARQAESDLVAGEQNQEHAQQSANAAPQTSRKSPKLSQDSAASLALADPFKDSNLPKSQRQEIASTASLVDPFAPRESLVDPFSASSADTQSSSGTSEKEKAIFEVSSGAIELSTRKAVSKLDQDISFLRSQSGQTINRAKANELIQEIQDTRSVLKTLNGFVTGGQYVVLLKEIASADSSGKRDEAWGDLVRQASSDLLHTDLAKEGMTKIAPRLFGERIGLMLAGAAEASFASGAILLDSTKTGRDPAEIIHDSSGKVSLSEKQNALMNMWNGYERRQSQTSNASDEALRRELWMNSNIVYNQCLEARSDCERWKNLLNHQ